MIVQCCVCKKIRYGNNVWKHAAEKQDSIHLEASHGYCPKCAKAAFQEIYESRRKQSAQYATTLPMIINI